KMQKGEIAKIRTFDDVYSEAVYVLYVEDIQLNPSKDFGYEKQELKKTLRYIKELSLYHKKVESIFDKAMPERLSDQKTDSLLVRFKKYERTEQVMENDFLPFLQDTILKYDDGSEKIHL